MFTCQPRIQIVTRVLLITVMLYNALVPVGNIAKAEQANDASSALPLAQGTEETTTPVLTETLTPIPTETPLPLVTETVVPEETLTPSPIPVVTESLVATSTPAPEQTVIVAALPGLLLKFSATPEQAKAGE